MAESTQPSLKSRALIRNKNNISEMILAKQIKDYEREQSLVIMSLDHDRLDMKHFLRQIKKCESDELPEARHWLRRRRECSEQKLHPTRDINTAPALNRNTPEEAKQDAAKETSASDVTSSGTFRTKRSFQSDGRPTLYSIFSRRAELVDPGPIWKTASALDDEKTAEKPDAGEEDAGDPESTMATSGGGGGEADGGRPEGGARRKPEEDFMKELLVNNATKRFRRRRAKPIEQRLREYYQKLDDHKRQQAASQPTAWQIRRRYVLLTQGVEAVINLSGQSDDERLAKQTSAPPVGRLS